MYSGYTLVAVAVPVDGVAPLSPPETAPSLTPPALAGPPVPADPRPSAEVAVAGSAGGRWH